jgi:hypothetical protein
MGECDKERREKRERKKMKRGVCHLANVILERRVP